MWDPGTNRSELFAVTTALHDANIRLEERVITLKLGAEQKEKGARVGIRRTTVCGRRDSLILSVFLAGGNTLA
jgi:hypothetical protein